MFFNSFAGRLSRVLLVLMGPGLFLTGCDYFLSRQGPPAEQRVVLRDGTLVCLHEVPARLTRFLSDELSEAEIRESFVCLRSMTEHFLKFTRGTEKPDQYTDSEMRSFLNEALPADRQVAPRFMEEIMNLKTLLLGGSSKILTRKEIEQARTLLGVLETESLRLRGKMRILLFQGPRDSISLQNLKAAQLQLEQSVASILGVSHAESTFYGFDDVQAFVGQLDSYLGNNRLLGQLLRWLPLTQKLKVLFLGEKTIASSQKDWQQVLGWSVRAYGLTLEFVYWIRNLPLNQPEEMNRLISFGDAIFDLVESSPVLRERSVFSLSALDDVLEEVINCGLLKTPLPFEVLQEGLRRVLVTILDGPSAPRRNPYEIEHITQSQLATLRFEWNVWALSQQQINQSFSRYAREGGSILFSQFLQNLDGPTMKQEMSVRPHLRPGEAKDLEQTWFEWEALMRGPHPMLWNTQNHLIIRHQGDYSNAQIGFEGMTRVNLLRSFTRILLRGYGTGSKRQIWDLRMTEPQFALFEEDFREIGRRISALDARTPSPADRTFKEASFFTFSGNGDSVLDANELFEELNILTSAGGVISSQLLEKAIAAGCAIDETDVFGKPYLRKDCFWKVFVAEFGRLFDGAPGLVALQMQMHGHIREPDFYNSIWRLGVAPYSRPGLIEYGELRTYGAVLYYIEILRLVYDRDQNLKLSLAEIQAAAPRFRSFMIERNPLGANLVDSFFSCLIFEQEKPAADAKTGLCLANLVFNGYEEIGPDLLLKVLAVLKADLTPPSTQFQHRSGVSGQSRF